MCICESQLLRVINLNVVEFSSRHKNLLNNKMFKITYPMVDF